MLSKFLVLFAGIALANNDTSSSSSEATGSSSSATGSGSGSSDNQTHMTGSSSTHSGNQTHMTGSSSQTATGGSSSGGTTTASSSGTTTNTASSSTQTAVTTGAPAGNTTTTTNKTVETTGNDITTAVALPVETKMDTADCGNKTVALNIYLISVGTTAKSLYAAGCGTMIGFCPAGKKSLANSKCCFSAAEISAPTPADLVTGQAFDADIYLYKKCTSRQLSEDNRRNLAEVDVKFTANPAISFNDADATLKAAMTASTVAVEAMPVATILSAVQASVTATTLAIATGAAIPGLTAAQLTGDATVTSMADAQTKFGALATATGVTSTASLKVSAPTVQQTGGNTAAATSSAVTTALSGAVIFVFAFLF